jgi:hypothetical protein
MSDDEINEEICKYNGWKFSDHPDHIAKTASWETAKSFAIKPDGEFVFRRSIPNYCSDLNAMHDVENWIIANKSSLWLFQDYAQTLRKNFQTLGLDGYIHATARQRAEAFLRTIGKWKEEAK